MDDDDDPPASIAPDNPDDPTARLIRAGQEALVRIRKGQTWTDWMAIGFAIDAGQRDIMRICQVNDPAHGGSRYSKLMGDWLTETGFCRVHTTVRSRLKDLIEHLPAVEMWRETLSED